MLFQLALRELWRSWRFGLFFIFNLSLGLTGFVSLEAFKEAIQTRIELNSKALLSADIAVSARRQITAGEHAKILQVVGSAPEAVTYEFFAMLATAKESRLVLVKAIDANFPFYGDLQMGDGSRITQTSVKDILQGETAWIYPELGTQLNLRVGETAHLGKLSLKISNTIEVDGTETFRASSLAPRIYINRDLLARSGLIQYGSTFSMNYLYQLPPTQKSEETQTQLYRLLRDPGIQVETPRTAGEEAGRQLAYLSDYLGLVSIVALFMSVLGASYIYRLYLSQKFKDIAIFRTLGLQSRKALGVYVLQVFFLGAGATLPTLLFAKILLPVLNRLLQSLTPFSLEPALSLRIFILSVLMSVFGSFVVSLPFLLKIKDLKPAKLFSEEKFSQDVAVRSFWPFLPGLLLFWGLSIYQAHSWKVGSAFILALFAVLILLVLVGWGGLQAMSRLPLSKRWFIKFSLLGLRRRRTASFAIFIAIGMGSLLMNVLPQLKTTLQAEFQIGEKSKLPSLFMFDIQDEQVDPLKSFLKERHLDTAHFSPMIRARILKINEQAYERTTEGKDFTTREDEREARFRNRGVNLSYRLRLSESETIVAGKDWSGSYTAGAGKPAELSVEYKYAERVGIKIGDQLTFDVQGVEVLGVVTNLRKVKWTSFQPNFFILFQDGVLNEAPKTFIASLPGMSREKKSSLQTELVQKFTNVSVIDVEKTVNDVLRTGEQMSGSLELMAGLALLTGYIVLFSILRSQLKQRRWELNMLKVLGASTFQVSAFILVESFVMTLFSSVAGAILSLGVSWSLAYFVFEADFRLNAGWPFLSVLCMTLISLFVALMAGFDIVRERPLEILRNEK